METRSYNDTVCETMAYIASVNGMESMAYSYLDLIERVEHEEEGTD